MESGLDTLFGGVVDDSAPELLFYRQYELDIVNEVEEIFLEVMLVESLSVYHHGFVVSFQ